MTRDMKWTLGTLEGCGRFAEALHPHVEGELDPIRTKLLEEHLAGCAACTRAEADLKMERLAFLEAAVETPELPDSFSEKVMERIRDVSRARRTRRRLRFAAAAGLVIFLGAAGSLELFRSGPIEPGSPPPLLTSAPVAPPPSTDHPRPPALRDEDARGGALPLVASPAAKGSEKATLEEAAALHEVPRPGLIAFTSQGAPLPGVRPESTPPVPVRTLGHVVGMVVRMGQPHDAPGRDDPCKPDPNKDGKTDLNDVAYSCQVLICGNLPSPLEALAAPADEADCDGPCLRI